MKLLEQELFPAAADGVPVIPAARQPASAPRIQPAAASAPSGGAADLIRV